MKKIYKERNIVRVKVAPAIWTYVLKKYPPKTAEEIKKFPHFDKWLKGESDPTVKQLQKFAKKFNIPFHYFLMETAPTEEPPPPLYRRGKRWRGNLSLELQDLLLGLRRIQNFVKEYLPESEFQPFKYAGQISYSVDVNNATDQLREILNLPISWNLDLKNKDQVFETLRTKAESLGILVFAGSTLWLNTKKRLDPNEFKGFCLADDIAPVIFINTLDYRSAQIFTLVHELVHAFMNQSEILGDGEELALDAEKVEVFCNAVTAELLAPKTLFFRLWEQTTGDVWKIAEKFKISPLVIAIRAKTFRCINEIDYQKFRNEYEERLKETEEKTKPEGPVSPYIRLRKMFSPRFVKIALDALKSEWLTYPQVYDYFHVKGETFHKFINRMIRELRFENISI